jgi:NAD(P)H-dependent FMN reductase
MKLTVFNGSPRGKDSNTSVLLENFLNGFIETSGNKYELAYLNRLKDRENFIKMFKEAEKVLLAFPLYTDAMPAIVKNFIESLEPLCGRKDNPDLGFIVQGGFPEALHSRPLERYLKKLTKRMGCRYTGTLIKGGAEGIKSRPPWMTRRIFESFNELGRNFGENGRFNEKLVLKLVKPEKLSRFRLLFFELLGKRLSQLLMWDKKLKENNAFDKRFARPYAT